MNSMNSIHREYSYSSQHSTHHHHYLLPHLLKLMASQKNSDRAFPKVLDGGHIKFFSVATLSSLLESEGFTEINFKFAGRVPYLWKTMLCSSRIDRN